MFNCHIYNLNTEYPRTNPPLLLAIFLLFPFAHYTQADTTPTIANTIDERQFLLEDYLMLEESTGDIIRPYRRQRNLMYRLQDALNSRGLNAGGRWNIWKSPFLNALKKYQLDSGMEATGKITPEVVKSLLGIDLLQQLNN